MSVADKAFIKKRQSDIVAASNLYKEALQLESKAADFFKDDYSAEPTRSVLYRSAASLAMNCFNYEEAERLTLIAMDGNPPLEIKKELDDIFSRLEIIWRIKDYNVDSFTKWFFHEFENGFNYSDNDLDENQSYIIAESLHIYNYLDYDLQLKYKKGLVNAFQILKFNKSNISNIQKIISLSCIVKADQIIEPIIDKFMDGSMDYSDDLVNMNLFDSILEIIIKLSPIEKGCGRIKKLIESSYFKDNYAIKTFIALSSLSPENFHNHLRVLRKFFCSMQLGDDFEDIANKTITAFIQALKNRTDIISNNMRFLKVYNVQALECSDYWFFKSLFIGESSPFKIDNLYGSFVIVKKGVDTVTYEIKTSDPLGGKDCVYEYMNFTKFLEFHTQEKKIYNSALNKNFPDLAAILRKNKIIAISTPTCLNY